MNKFEGWTDVELVTLQAVLATYLVWDVLEPVKTLLEQMRAQVKEEMIRRNIWEKGKVE